VAAKRNGSKVISGFAVPSGIYPCNPAAERLPHVYTSRTNPAHWRRLLEVLIAGQISDPRFDTWHLNDRST
jgi:hypothetical protein